MKNILSLLFAITLAASAEGAVILTLSSNHITGTPGSTVGWGYTLSSTAHHLTVVNVLLLPASPLGTFQEILASVPGFEVGPAPSPSTSVTEAFNAVLNTGIASFAIDSGAAIGSVYSGTMYVVWNLYNVSPNHDPLFDPFDPSHTFEEGVVFEIPVTITVVDPSAVPEPSTLGMIGCAAVGLAVSRRWRTRRH